MSPPSAGLLFGADKLGRDLFARIVYAMSSWAWLAVVLVAVAIIVVGFLVVQARRRGGGVIATVRRKDKGAPQ